MDRMIPVIALNIDSQSPDAKIKVKVKGQIDQVL